MGVPNCNAQGVSMSESISRRDALLKIAGLAAGSGAVCAAAAAAAAEPPHLTTTDPTAVALGYHESAGTVDPKKFTTYQPGQSCSTCLQLQGNAGDPWRPCNLFPGKLVNAGGWCRVWVKRPA
jgi:High potential iron-sulfur protein